MVSLAAADAFPVQPPEHPRLYLRAAQAAELEASELPDKQDACRVTGRAMVTGAIAYDWLCRLLTPEEKLRAYDEKRRNPGAPPF